MAGRHRKPRQAGLPPLLSGAAIAATLVVAVSVATPEPVPVPGPTPAVRAPASTPAPTFTPATTTPPPVVALTVIPDPTTTAPPPAATATPPTTRAPEPTPERPADVAPEPPDEPQSSPKCRGLGVEAHVQVACNLIMAAVPGVTVVGGKAPRPGNPTSCHPKRLALDFMVYDDNALGDRLFAFIGENKALLGVTTLLWEVPDHWDHVHASFAPCKH